jgi:tripartite-type tricarboxylate transporter receptor subunit TctC
MVTTNLTIVGNRFLFKDLPYDPDNDLTPVTQLANIDMILLAHTSLPANNLKELVELAKKEPGRISYASYGNGSQPHLLMELLNSRESIQLLHVPYKGLGPALTAVMAGESNLTLSGRGTATAAINSGKTKVLTTMSDARDPELPNVPTSAESGYPYFRVPTWHGLFAPKNVPKDLLARIQRDVATVTSRPEFVQDMLKRGYTAPASTPEVFAAAIREEVKQTAEMVKAAGLKPE